AAPLLRWSSHERAQRDLRPGRDPRRLAGLRPAPRHVVLLGPAVGASGPGRLGGDLPSWDGARPPPGAPGGAVLLDPDGLRGRRDLGALAEPGHAAPHTLPAWCGFLERGRGLRHPLRDDRGHARDERARRPRSAPGGLPAPPAPSGGGGAPLRDRPGMGPGPGREARTRRSVLLLPVAAGCRLASLPPRGARGLLPPGPA